MKTTRIMIKSRLLLILGFILIVAGCKQMSEHEADLSAGLNGGFEISKNNLPVNWWMYNPKTVPDADFEIVLDKNIYKEGKQSLKFEVKKCNSIGGWRSPGFTNEFFEVGRFKGEGRYKLSFWVKNEGSTFKISAGGVATKEGDETTLIEEKKQISDWKRLEYQIDVPKDRWLRMELNILQPGTFWIDDIKIEKI
jgi:hypothetical protein